MERIKLIELIKSAKNADDLQKIADQIDAITPSEREALEPFLEDMGDRFLAKAKETINTVKTAMQLDTFSNYMPFSYMPDTPNKVVYSRTS